MLTILLIIALVGTIILIFHVSLELNALEKRVIELTNLTKEHYGPKPND